MGYQKFHMKSGDSGLDQAQALSGPLFPLLKTHWTVVGDPRFPYTTLPFLPMSPRILSWFSSCSSNPMAFNLNYLLLRATLLSSSAPSHRFSLSEICVPMLMIMILAPLQCTPLLPLRYCHNPVLLSEQSVHWSPSLSTDRPM